MNSIYTELLTLAKKLDQYAKDATGSGATGTTYWLDTTHYRATCPVDKRWLFQYGISYRDVSATQSAKTFDSSDNVLAYIRTDTAGTGETPMPEAGYVLPTPIIMDAGDYFENVFGVAQGASAYHTFTVLEVDV